VDLLQLGAERAISNLEGPIIGRERRAGDERRGLGSFESPDGGALYFTPTAAVGTRTPLWRVPTSDGPAVKVRESILNGSFAVLDRGIYYIDQPSDEAQLQTWP
jgi:hypothetical protein